MRILAKHHYLQIGSADQASVDEAEDAGAASPSHVTHRGRLITAPSATTADLVHRLQEAWDRSRAAVSDPQLSLLGGEK